MKSRIVTDPTTSGRGAWAIFILAGLFGMSNGVLASNRLGAESYSFVPTKLAMTINSDAKAGTSHYGQSNRRGKLFLDFSIPYINSFYLTPDNEPDSKVNTGFWGLSAGLDYYHSKTQFLSVSASFVMDAFIPVPAAVDFSGERESMYSTYISLSNNHITRKFALGYGVCYGENVWRVDYFDEFDPPPRTRDDALESSHTVGLVFPASYMRREHFYFGIIYRPTLVRFGAETNLKYEHVISIDFGWEISLN